jgi:hypothetical protein
LPVEANISIFMSHHPTIHHHHRFQTGLHHRFGNCCLIGGGDGITPSPTVSQQVVMILKKLTPPSAGPHHRRHPSGAPPGDQTTGCIPLPCPPRPTWKMRRSATTLASPVTTWILRPATRIVPKRKPHRIWFSNGYPNWAKGFCANKKYSKFCRSSHIHDFLCKICAHSPLDSNPQRCTRRWHPFHLIYRAQM